jgi:acetylornithine deacetylase/succinyl-diaminopimelate desuccinylase-like protein
MDFNKYKVQLSNIIKFQSISTDPQFKDELVKTANYLKRYLEDHKFNVDIWTNDNSNPVVFGSYEVNPQAETILIYGHYDVQPADKSNGWEKDPFELFEKGNRLIARGTVDNKGQFFIHMFNVCELIKQDNLKYNVKFLIEGNEETANEVLPSQIEKYQKQLKSDYILISDGENIGDYPVIDYSFRGGCNFKLTVKTAQNNLHSGLYGGVTPNAAFELTKIISSLYDDEGHLSKELDFFYKDVDEIPNKVLEKNKKVASNEEVLKMTGAKKIISEENYDPMTQAGLRPTVQITGLNSGYTSEGYSNIVPFKAEVKINVRTVASQDIEAIMESFEEYFDNVTPDYVDYTIERTNGYEPVKADIQKAKVKEIEKELEKAFGKEVIYKPVGGGIPIINTFQKVLKTDVISVSLGNEDCNMHGVNENFNIDILKKGLEFSYNFFKND